MDKPDDKPTQEEIDRIVRGLFNLPEPPPKATPKAKKDDSQLQNIIDNLTNPF